MVDNDLAELIKNRALGLGYDQCGIIRVGEMAGYAEKLADRMADYPEDRRFLERLSGFTDVTRDRPWARSVIILVRGYGQYKIPDKLKNLIASIYLVGQGPAGKDDSRSFGDFLAGQGIRAETSDRAGLTAMRWAAFRAGLGLIRKNNFFYTAERGSWVFLTAWLIDRELELKGEPNLKACPDNCDKCLSSCPTSALRRPFSMKPTDCVSYLTGFGGDVLMDNPLGSRLNGWIYGCDACQSACPFNQIIAPATESLPGLDEFADQVSPARIIDMDYGAIEKLLSEKFWYISKDRLWKWKINALNAMKNNFDAASLPWIEKACDDSAEQVRAMAAWVLSRVKNGVSSEQISK